jgi:hypothetical protein
MVHDLLLGFAIAAAVVAALPIAGYPFAGGSWIDPYRSRGARWVVYLGCGIALILFVILKQGSA